MRSIFLSFSESNLISNKMLSKLLSTQVIRRSFSTFNHVINRRPAMLLTNILVSMRCTQRCRQCNIYEYEGGPVNFTLADFIRCIDILERHGTQFVSLSGGEPMVNPELDNMIRYASGKNFLNLQLLTNLYAKETVVNRIIDTVLETGTSIQVSFDGFGETVDKLRGAKNIADTVIRGIERIDSLNSSLTKPVRTSLNVVISKQNMEQLPEILDFIAHIGWNATVDFYRWTSPNHQEHSDMKITDSDEIRNAVELMLQSKYVSTPAFILKGYDKFAQGNMEKRCPYLECPSLGSKFYIEPNGNINACLGGAIGNIFSQSPNEIFESSAWDSMLEDMNQCTGCWNTCYTPAALAFHPRSINDAISSLNLFSTRR